MIAGIASLLGAASPLIERLIPDKDKQIELKAELEKLYLEQSTAQIKVNQTEATHRSVWVAGWRPYIGWTCGTIFLWHFLARDLVIYGAAFAGYDVSSIPSANIEGVYPVLLGMLGIGGGLRTLEKIKGVAK